MFCINFRHCISRILKEGVFYKNNPKLPVYSYHSTCLDTQEIVNALLDPDLTESSVCSIQPDITFIAQIVMVLQ